MLSAHPHQFIYLSPSLYSLSLSAPAGGNGGGRAPLLPRSPVSGFAGGGDAAGSSHRRPHLAARFEILKVALSDCLC
uniref:Uncharacterized protein n=1 Tax=Oryza glumipatula TaxID=40148 RepID=A0A0D9Y5Q9_9ORYZ